VDVDQVMQMLDSILVLSQATGFDATIPSDDPGPGAPAHA
jgi:hypothetical protein